MSNIYFIHLDHDIGRYSLINLFADKMGGYIWKGVNKRICDKNGYILNAKSHKLGTQGCSESVIQIINYSKINFNF